MCKYNYNTSYCIVLDLLCVTEIWEEKKYNDGTLVSSSDHITVISIIIVTMIMMIMTTVIMTITIIIVTLIKTIMMIMTMMTMMTITVISDHDDDNSHRFWKTPSEEAAPLALHSCQDDTCR